MEWIAALILRLRYLVSYIAVKIEDTQAAADARGRTTILKNSIHPKRNHAQSEELP